MRHARLILLVLAVVMASPAQAGTTQALELSFAVPANFAGTLDAGGFQTLVLLLPDAGAAQLLLAAPAPAIVANHTVRYATQAGGGQTNLTLPLPNPQAPEPSAMALDGMRLAAHAPGPATLVVEARAITVAVDSPSARLLHRLDGSLPSTHLAGAVDPHAYRTPAIPAAYVHLTGDVQGLWLHAEGLRRVEWHNLAPACPDGAPCPAAGGRSATETGLLPGRQAGIASYTFVEAGFTDGAATLDGAAPAGRFLAAGPVVGLRVNGTARLPLAGGATACAACAMPDGRTLTVAGDLALDGVATGPDGRMRAAVGGDLQAAAFDEQAVAPGALFGLPLPAAVGVAAVGAGLGLFALLKLLPLLTRLRDPLGHPRRRDVLGYVQERPGATFREVVRGTGLAVGSGRHHLAVLKRSGLLVERRHGHSLRYFENHDKYATGWESHVLLREPALATLHAWVLANPGRPQKEILEAHALAGWPARTTRSRLHRLAAVGLVTAQPVGRQKLYRAAAAGVVPAAALSGLERGAAGTS
ncbi:MAG: hypothetical protein QOD77_1946 [Thermoplasmata archaeon]|jgi:DNA-binding transcriptional ArsR family regulator|nr:hypothetical protein [Thermoplasmata archaeon]